MISCLSSSRVGFTTSLACCSSHCVMSGLSLSNASANIDRSSLCLELHHSHCGRQFCSINLVAISVLWIKCPFWILAILNGLLQVKQLTIPFSFEYFKRINLENI